MTQRVSQIASVAANPEPAEAGQALRRRNLLGACLAHFLHDGYTDQLYALLPVWQSQFGLSYAGLAVVRALYYGTMGGLQIPADRIMSRISPRSALVLATITAAAGYLVMALPFGLPSLCLGLIVAGIGSSVQHPRASLLVTQSYRDEARGPLGTYNFTGDLGKSVFPAVLVGRGIRVNAVAPGSIETPAMSKMGMTRQQQEDSVRFNEAQIPMGRVGHAVEVANAVTFLASSEASYITGFEVNVDGGRLQL